MLGYWQGRRYRKGRSFTSEPLSCTPETEDLFPERSGETRVSGGWSQGKGGPGSEPWGDGEVRGPPAASRGAGLAEAAPPETVIKGSGRPA